MVADAFDKQYIRLDLFLFYIRLFKSRSLSTKYIISSRLRISGQLTQKPHKLISNGDTLTIPINDEVKIFEVIDIPKRRGPYSEAILYYRDLTPQKKIDDTNQKNKKIKFVDRVGRPTKLERRQTDKLMGRI